MKLSLGPIEVSVNRKTENPTEQKLGTKALDTLNDAVLNQMSHLTEAAWQARLASVSLPALETEKDYQKASKILQDHGIVIVQSFLRPANIEGAVAKIGSWLDQVSQKIDQGESYEDDRIAVQIGVGKLTSYEALATYSKPVATVRAGADQGMIDIFNVDGLVGDHRDDLRTPFSNPWLLKLLADYHEGLSPQNLNLYLNRSITKTRGFHVDNFERNLKGFVYLSDVAFLSDGPYCYVKGTNKPSVWQAANKKVSELFAAPTEAPFVNFESILPVLAKAGSLILSDQSGVHRGIPQAQGAERQVLVMRYK